MKRMLFLLGLLVLLLTPTVLAHDHPEYFPLEEAHTHTDSGGVIKSVSLHAPDASQGLWASVVFYVWTMHDKIHWIVIVLMLYTCYHFRYAVGRLLGKPGRACPRTEDEFYNGENKLHAYHRYFWWANVFLIGIHWAEVLTGLRYGIVNYTYDFTFQALGVYVELFYVIAFTLWLASCHFFRFFVGETCGACRGYDVVSKGNNWHGFFMWLAILSFVLLILLQGHL